MKQLHFILVLWTITLSAWGLPVDTYNEDFPTESQQQYPSMIPNSQDDLDNFVNFKEAALNLLFEPNGHPKTNLSDLDLTLAAKYIFHDTSFEFSSSQSSSNINQLMHTLDAYCHDQHNESIVGLYKRGEEQMKEGLNNQLKAIELFKDAWRKKHTEEHDKIELDT